MESSKIWHSSRELPKMSGWYIVFTNADMIATFHWSNLHKAWNAFDEVEPVDELNKSVIAWAYYEDIAPTPIHPVDTPTREECEHVS